MKVCITNLRGLVCIAAGLLTTSSLMAQGTQSPHIEWENIASEKPVEFLTPPDDPDVTDSTDAEQLVDGNYALVEPIWYDNQERSPVGWVGPETVEFVVDLAKVEPIRGVAIRVGASTDRGVAWPEQIRISVSEDGESYSPVVELMEVTPLRPGSEMTNTVWLQAEDLQTHGRFVKFSISPGDSGNGIFFYTDELEIYRGEDEWLSIALPGPGQEPNPDSPHPDLENLARGAAVRLNSEPNDAGTADSGDIVQLVDGALSPSTPLWSDKSAVGWVGSAPAEFTIDLGKDQPIQGVSVRTAAGAAGVEWPHKIEVYVSVDGNEFSSVGDLIDSLPEDLPPDEYSARWLTATGLETHGRYVKFVFTPTDQGNGAYIFVDEVEVYRGDDAFLQITLAKVAAPDQWMARWDQFKWRDHLFSVPEGERPRQILTFDGDNVLGANALVQEVVATPEAVSFTLLGEAGKPRALSWTSELPDPISTQNCPYVLLSFRAEGIRRTYNVRPLVTLRGLSKGPDGNEVVLIEANLPLNDGLTHTLVQKLPEGFVLEGIRIEVVTEDDAPRLTLERLELLSAVPDVFTTEIRPAETAQAGLVPVDLAPMADDNLVSWFDRVLETRGVVMDGVRTLPPGPVAVSGVPFEIGEGEMNLVKMPETRPSDERVKFLRQMVDRRYLEPVSRHDELSVDVDASAREVFLLLALNGPPTHPRGGVPDAPLKLDDRESLLVELHYDQGETELAFPYSMADESCYVPNRELAAYAVAADPTRKLRKVTLHNRHFGPAFALAGITLNTADQPLVPALSEFPPPLVTKSNPEPPAGDLLIERQGPSLTFSNRWYQYRFDFSQGFVIEQIVNRWAPDVAVSSSDSGGLRVRVGDHVYTGRSFRSELVSVSDTSATIRLVSAVPELPLELTVTITGSTDQPKLSFSTVVKNVGAEALNPAVMLPYLDAVSLGELAETAIFFPQYRTVDTREDIALRAPYGPEFTSQFMDVYNAEEGFGVMFQSDNSEQKVAAFALRKDATGVSGGIEFSSSDVPMKPGEEREDPEVALIAHRGDWQEAFGIYREWVRSWYRPHRSQDKDFFLNAWDLMCYRTSKKVSWSDARVPPIITEDRTEWLLEETFAFEMERLGHIPDLSHFFNWTYNDKAGQNEYGVHSTTLAYEQVGGVEFFREGISKIQEKWKSPVSLYTLHDRIRISAVPDKALVQELIETSHYQEMDTDISSALRASGEVDGIVFLRPGHPEWTEFFIADLVKMQKDTGCKLVYIDVFPYFSHISGDEISPLQASLTAVKQIREELPADVVLWTEYPFTDVASQYADGSLNYYFMDVSEVFARRYNVPDSRPELLAEMPFSVQRFVTPTYRTIGLPGYIEVGTKPSQIDAVFFNGEAIQEDTYRLHHSRMRERLNRSYRIKKAYTECFNSPDAMPRVPTEARGLIANSFPGSDRNVWTIFNSRPNTYTGPVLQIPHIEGATYRDVWNERDLVPEIVDGVAHVSLSVDPLGLACVVQSTRAEVASNATLDSKISRH